MKQFGLLLLAVSALSFSAFAQTVGSRVCSDATLYGSYGFSITGERPAGPGQPVELIVGTAITTFDGAGHLRQVDNVHGFTGDYLPDRAGTGTYSLNSNCTGTMLIQNAGTPFALVLKIAVVNAGKEVRAAVVDVFPRASGTPIPPIMVQSSGRKM